MIPILKLRIYSTKDRLPRLIKDKSGGSNINRSHKLIIYWCWKHRPNEIEDPKLGTYCQHTDSSETFWQIDGITGNTIILGWGYTKNLKT